MVPSLTEKAYSAQTRYQGTSRDVSVYQFRHETTKTRLPDLIAPRQGDGIEIRQLCLWLPQHS